MGSARGAFTCLVSSTSSQRPENIYNSVLTRQQYLRRVTGIAKKRILPIRALMIGQQNDLVASDFNRTAWRCSNENNISTIVEAFTDCFIANAARPYTIVGTWIDPKLLG